MLPVGEKISFSSVIFKKIEVCHKFWIYIQVGGLIKHKGNNALQ